MKPISFSAEDFGIVDFRKFELPDAEIPEFKAFLEKYCPQYINHSRSRKDKSIPLAKPDPGNVLRWNGYVGVLHMLYPQEEPKYEVTIRFHSRFDSDKKHYFLAALLQSWLENSVNSVSFDDVVTNASWDEIFDFMSVAVFRKQLMDAYETGIYRGYRYFEDNSDRLRGSIDIPRHIRLNLGMNNGKIAMRYRENTPDNAMNHLILHTYNELKQRHPRLVSALIEGDSCGTVLESLRYLAPSYRKTGPAAVAAKLRQPISNPLYGAYELLRGTCLRILEEQGAPVIQDGEDREDSILFYAPDLWENFIERRILSRLDGVKVDPQYEEPCLDGRMTSRPDFVLSKGGGRIVLDAKYKKLWRGFSNMKSLEDHEKKVLETDIKQCLVYYTVLQAAYSGIIFPAQAPMGTHNFKAAFSQYDPQRKKGGSFRVFGVLLPEDGNYQQWRKALTESEKDTARNIQALCEEIGASAREETQ